MGWVDSLRGHRVGLDTALFIYYTERHPVYLNYDLLFKTKGLKTILLNRTIAREAA